MSTKTPSAAAATLPLDLIDADHWPNPRGPIDTNSDSFLELAGSIAAVGILQPIVVGPPLLDGGRHPVIAGWRRHAAATAAKLESVPVHQRHDITDQRDALRAAIAENMAREDMTPIAEAEALYTLMQLGDTQAEAATALGISERTARERLRLRKLPQDLQIAIGNGEIPTTATRILEQIAEHSPQAASAVGRTINRSAPSDEHPLDRYTVEDLETMPQEVLFSALDNDPALEGEPTGAGLVDVTAMRDGGGTRYYDIARDELPLDPEIRDALAARCKAAAKAAGLHPAAQIQLPADTAEKARAAGALLDLQGKGYNGQVTHTHLTADRTIIAEAAEAAVAALEKRMAQEAKTKAKTAKAKPGDDPHAQWRELQLARHQENDAIHRAAQPHAEKMNAQLAERLAKLDRLVIEGAVAELLVQLAAYGASLEHCIEQGLAHLLPTFAGDQAADQIQDWTQARDAECGAALLVAAEVAYNYADRRGPAATTHGWPLQRVDVNEPMQALTASIARDLKLLPGSRPDDNRKALAEYQAANAYHARDANRLRILHELAKASKAGLLLQTLRNDTSRYSYDVDPGVSPSIYSSGGVDEFAAALEDLEAAGAVTETTSENKDTGAIDHRIKITPAGTAMRKAGPQLPPLYPAIDPDPEPQPEPPAKAKVTPKGAANALEQITAKPGITIPELADALQVKQNTLYRLLPGLEKDGHIRKEGRGWHPTTNDGATA